MAEERVISKHCITMEKRENLTATGVLDVISFDEETVIADTDAGVMIIKGRNLHVNRLNLEKGDLQLDGEINNITYEESGSFSSPKGSLFEKLFK